MTSLEGVQVGRSVDKPDIEIRDGHFMFVTDGLKRLVHDALKDLPVVGRLVNLTGGATVFYLRAIRRRSLCVPRLLSRRCAARTYFKSGAPDLIRAATDALLELASYAKPKADGLPLLAARVHALFRGLPGLWACADTHCPDLPDGMAVGPTGALYAQSTRECKCRSRVFEVHTCRDCGVAYFQAFALNPNLTRLSLGRRCRRY